VKLDILQEKVNAWQTKYFMMEDDIKLIHDDIVDLKLNNIGSNKE
jgi:hypothetical protein